MCAEWCNGIKPKTPFENRLKSADGCDVISKFYCREARKMGAEINNLLVNSYFNNTNKAEQCTLEYLN